jgi:threonyl-tRNA synthetase
MIHRAPFGSMERFIAVLLEHCGGNLPLWLAPLQVKVLPISDKYSEYAHQVAHSLKDTGIRAEVDDRNEKIGRKIRDTELMKVPYMLVVGEKEMTENTVSVRKHGEGDKGAMPISAFASEITDSVNEQIKGKKRNTVVA